MQYTAIVFITELAAIILMVSVHGNSFLPIARRHSFLLLLAILMVTNAAEWLAACLDGAPAGFALYFFNFSTFLARRGLYLEDLFVRPSARGSGAGKALLANLARRCFDEGLGRLEWSVLDWNAPSIAFYKAMGAVANDEWTQFRVAGPALSRLAGEATP